jgi:glyoxylase-like metal-dependent hydrolase (beta-lactamase superfamily II)
MTTFVAGGYECELIADGHGVLPPEIAFAGAPPDELEVVLAGRLDESGRLPIPYGCLLVRPPDGPVLVDAGIGEYEHPAGGRGGELEARLEAAGVTADEIRYVVITHSHLDHIGGLCVDGRPRFSSARHVISPGHLAVEVGGAADGALYVADALLDPLTVQHPEWGLAFDEDGDVAIATRGTLLDRAHAEGRILAAAHTPAPGRVEASGGGLRFAALDS